MNQRMPTAQEVQDAIGRVRGVVASRVVTKDGAISEVHVLAHTGRSAKQIVRDVESVCAAQFGITLDHRKVSVAVIHSPEKAERPPLRRPVISGVRVETGGRRTRVHVTLGVGDAVYEGSAESIGGAAHRVKVAAAAALDALQRYVGDGCRFELDDLVPFHLGGWDGYLAGVVMVSAFGEEHLVGSALVKIDPLDAAIRAALDAVNRRIPIVAREGVRIRGSGELDGESP
ncbi:MAG: hypothetical protein CW345_09905 [Firmicutes bacterium]|nr:hypothetical protein [Bacillota bacterium]MBO2522091.1 hypothetical protein [Bacillota bacterium]